MKKDFIFIDINGNTAVTSGIALAKDIPILYQGEDIDKMLASNGWVREQIPGLFKNKEGFLQFSQERYDKFKQSQKPVVTGKQITDLIRSNFQGVPWKQRKALLQAVSVDFQLLDTIETVSKVVFNEFVESIEESLLASKAIDKETIDTIKYLVVKHITDNHKFTEEVV